MVVSEIINRDVKQSFSVQELTFVVEEYIFQRKAKRVSISLEKGLVLSNYLHQVIYQDQVQKLIKAYDKACTWFRENKA